MRKIILTTYILFILLVSTGCWDSVDINDKNIITAVAIDNKEDEIYFYVEIPNLAKSGGSEGGGGDNYGIVKGQGKDYTEARWDLNDKMDKPLFLGTVRALILTENQVKDGGIDYLHRLQSLFDYRKAVGIITTRENIEDLLKVQPENNVSVGYSIEDTMDTLNKLGEGVVTTTSQALEWIYSKNVCFTIPNIDICDEKLTLTGYSVIHNNELAGFIPAIESEGLVWFLNPQGELIYVVPFGENNENEVTIRIELKDKNISPYYNKGKASFDVSFDFSGRIMYRDKDISLTDERLAEINENLQKMLLDHIVHTVKQSRKFECEYLGFDDAFRVSYPTLFEEMDWTQTYLESEINLKVKNKLDPGGLMDFNPDEKK